MKPSKPLNVCYAIIEHEGKILIAHRGAGINNPGKWEFPGGKLEPGETPEQCLKREIIEELDLKIRITGFLSPVTYHYPDNPITLIPFICKSDGNPPKLFEHQNIAWINPACFTSEIVYLCAKVQWLILATFDGRQ